MLQKVQIPVSKKLSDAWNNSTDLEDHEYEQCTQTSTDLCCELHPLAVVQVLV